MTTRTEPMTKQDFLCMTPEIAFKQAKLDKKNGKPFNGGEAIISTDAKYSFWYAKYVLRGPFKLGEPIIDKDPTIAALYKTEVLERDFAGEDRDRDRLIAAFGLGNYHI